MYSYVFSNRVSSKTLNEKHFIPSFRHIFIGKYYSTILHLFPRVEILSIIQSSLLLLESIKLDEFPNSIRSETNDSNDKNSISFFLHVEPSPI